MVMLGKLKLEGEQSLIAEARQWLEEQRDQVDAFSAYLEQWGDWRNPWTTGQEAVENTG
jgi:hypothetical protein